MLSCSYVSTDTTEALILASEVKQVDQKLTTFHEEVEEAEKKSEKTGVSSFDFGFSKAWRNAVRNVVGRVEEACDTLTAFGFPTIPFHPPLGFLLDMYGQLYRGKRKELSREYLKSNSLENPEFSSPPPSAVQIASLSTRPDYLVMEVIKTLNSKSGSNLTKVMWKVEILKAVDCSTSQSTGGNGEISKVTWRIENFSSFKKDQRLCSEKFSVDGNKWRLTIYPKGNNNNVDHLSIYLAVADSATLPPGLSRFLQYGFSVISQIDRKNSIARVAKKEFKAKESGWGMPLLALSELQNPKRGYLLNDACLVEAYISTDRTDGLISRELILETNLDKHKTKEADRVNAAIHNQTTMKTEPITSLSTRPDNLVMEVNNKCGSNLPKVMWMVEILKAMNDSKDGNGEIAKVTWRIENFSSIEDEEICSEAFIVDDIKLQLVIFPKGDKTDHLSFYLEVSDPMTLPPGWRRFIRFGFAVIDQIDRQTSKAIVAHAQFNETISGRGKPEFLPLGELHDPERGYLVNDVCLVEAYVSTDYTEDLISYELILDTDSDKHEAFEPEEPSEEDIKTFFSSLESELSSSDSVFSKEEAKEALAKLDEAMNMTPADFYDSGKFSPLKQAFKILASFNCSSTTLTIEQINELLAMEESLKDLADRAARVVQNKSRLTEKESIKLTITRNLGSNLIRYKEVESEVKQVEQKLAAFHEQVEEAQKARENMLGELKGIFRSSKRMEVELEALEKKRAEYEADAEVAEKEEKTVEAEWGRMKDFISSIKGKI
ncbi:hypothetical protein V6N11_079753 [Hibiscus sabdariffa]|uniref:MATH domain-containing protein n=1 Tax=Hibiscus sabdariffa TaxID=183260 RepID=A0ABR2RWT8_9ROSI